MDNNQSEKAGIKKPRPGRGGVLFESVRALFSVTFLETVYAASGIEHLVLTGIKRM